MKRLATAVVCLILICSICTFAQQPSRAAALFKQLADPGVTDQAAEQLLKLCEQDESARAYLGQHLPAFFANGPTRDEPKPWFNAVHLAGELKIAEVAPALEKWIGVARGGTLTLTSQLALENFPVGKALAQIGDPSIPTLVAVFKHPEKVDRQVAVHALRIIGSATARTALAQQLDRETDNGLRDHIRKVLEDWKESS
jgi:hypothetical protein